MTNITQPSPHWRRAARPYIDRLHQHCGLSDSAHAEVIVAEAMQAAAEHGNEKVAEIVRDLERRAEVNDWK